MKSQLHDTQQECQNIEEHLNEHRRQTQSIKQEREKMASELAKLVEVDRNLEDECKN